MVIAVDFDGTLCEHCYPEIGQPHVDLIQSLIEARKRGHKLILCTCREDEYLAAGSSGHGTPARAEQAPDVV